MCHGHWSFKQDNFKDAIKLNSVSLFVFFYSSVILIPLRSDYNKINKVMKNLSRFGNQNVTPL
jgi:hypothetical protein